MAQDVVQVARDPLAFGNRGEMLDLLICLAQLVVHSIALCKERVSRADDHRKDRRVEQSPVIDVQQQAFDTADRPNRRQTDGRRGLCIDAETAAWPLRK